MHVTPNARIGKKNSFHNFLNRSNFAFNSFFSKKKFNSKIVYVMFMFTPWRLLERYILFAYFSIIFLGQDWFGFFLNKWVCIRFTP